MHNGRMFAGNDNIVKLRLMSMPARAREIAAKCGSEEISELLELHAGLCERNSTLPFVKRRRAKMRLVEIV